MGGSTGGGGEGRLNQLEIKQVGGFSEESQEETHMTWPDPWTVQCCSVCAVRGQPGLGSACGGNQNWIRQQM